MSRARNLKIAIDIQATTRSSGGVGQANQTLINGLGKLQDGSETYTLIVRSEEQRESLKKFAGPNQQFVIWPASPQSTTSKPSLLRRALRPLGRYVRDLINPNPPQWPEVPLSNGAYEALRCDVLHLPTQRFTLCALPTVYNPHDLQHLHYPQFSTPHTLAYRETVYPAGCHFANTVVVGSQFIKDDIIRHYRTNPDKIQIIPECPSTESVSEPTEELLTSVKEKYRLEQPFAFYPAITWPHKNHLGLLDALAHLRDNCGIVAPLVCTGSRFERFWPRVEARVAELRLESQVKFLGFVPQEDLRAIYRLAQFLIQPTLFEASSLPIFEAWMEGIPVACSNVTALPDQVMDAGLLFDPNDVEAIANAMIRMSEDSQLRDDLKERGYRRVKDFDRERTAKAYRAVYRRAGGLQLTEEDRWLLSCDWMREPQRTMEVGIDEKTVYSGGSAYAGRE